MTMHLPKGHIYDGEGDRLLGDLGMGERIVVIPDAKPSRTADLHRRMRIMWGQHLLDDLVAGRYRSLVCAVNSQDNSRGIIAQLAELLPTSQWDEQSITAYAAQFARRDRVTVLKYDMDVLEVLALLRPSDRDHLTLEDLKQGFELVTQMLARKPERLPVASVCFLGARANRLLVGDHEPSFETVLRTMYEAGFAGDVYPALWMWEAAPIPVYARYPFPASIDSMREGGF